MRYPSIRYAPESEDPSVVLETHDLVAHVIDNTGLVRDAPMPVQPLPLWDVDGEMMPVTKFLGYHGIHQLHARDERRNIIAYAALNWQGVQITGRDLDEPDERSRFGRPRGWPMEITRDGETAVLSMPTLPTSGLSYELRISPAEPDAFDFSCRWAFTPGRKVEHFKVTFACYMNGWDDVTLHYPQADAAGAWRWCGLGERPPGVVGTPIRYEHEQASWGVEQPAAPLAYGRIGERALVMMFSDDRVGPFVVNAGGHMPWSSVLNPAWDFAWAIDNPPIGEAVGFDGRLCYARIADEEDVAHRYAAWCDERDRGIEDAGG